MAFDSWKATPGRRPGPALPIGDLLTRGYEAHAWMLKAYSHEPLGRRVQKGRFCTRMKIPHPTMNKYLRAGGIPFPFPPAEHLVFVVDVDDKCVRWVSPSLCVTLQHAEDYFIGKYAPGVFRGDKPAEPGHREALGALRDGTLDLHKCNTTFIRGDGWWVPLSIKVSYGEGYRVWFVDAVLDGEATAPPSINGPPAETFNTTGVLILQHSVPVPSSLRRVAQWIHPNDLERQAAFVRSIKPSVRCKTCVDYGYVRLDLPVEHPDFGKAVNCPDCNP